MDSVGRIWVIARSVAMTTVSSLVTAQGMFEWVPHYFGPSPAPRAWHTMCEGPGNQAALLFGGQSPSGLLSDTWLWDGDSWIPLSPTNAPTARFAAAMALDPIRHKVVLFGGDNITYLGDTWEWDGITWTSLSPPVSPSPRKGHSMSFDPINGRTLLYGGQGGLNGTYGDDTWEWDGGGWTQRHTSTNAGRRAFGSMTYDSTRQRVQIYGGGVTRNLYEWDGSNWLQRQQTVNPSPPDVPLFAHVPGRGTNVTMFNGFQSFLAEWDGSNWTTIPVPYNRSNRSAAPAVFVPSRNHVLVFGGYTNGVWWNDTWKLQYFPAATAAATAFGISCGSPQLTLQGDPQSRPILGQIARANITNSPSPFAAMSIGASRTFMFPISLPFELTSVGMPGCYLLQSNDIANLGTSPGMGGTATFEAFLPTLPSLLGQHIYMQAYSLAPGYNQLGFVASNGLDWVLGDN